MGLRGGAPRRRAAHGTAHVRRGGAMTESGPDVFELLFGIMIGAALGLRDLVQRRHGAFTSVGCIVAGAALSFVIASPALAVASGVAFLISEFADFAVYTPLARRRLLLAVALSGIVGAVVDSVAFLLIAFGNVQFLTGQVLGKIAMVAASLPVVAALRRLENHNTKGHTNVEPGTHSD